MEELGEAQVCLEILTPIVGMRPAGMLREHLTPQLLGNAERLDRSEARDALAPVGVLGLTRRAPISRDELANPSRNHQLIVARCLTRLQHPRPFGAGNGRQRRSASADVSAESTLPDLTWAYLGLLDLT